MILSKANQAYISWCRDALSCIAVLILLGCWLIDIDSTQPIYISKSFVANGFCLSPLFNNTHLICAEFDFVCGIFCLMAIMMGKARAMGAAAYFFAHGFGHYSLAVEENMEERDINLQDTLVLAAILSIGPLSITSQLVDAKKMNRQTANVMATLMLCILVGVYTIYIRRPSYALLYINISIMISQSFPKTIMIGFKSKDDIEYRSSRLYWLKMSAEVLVLAVILCEPFFCDQFVAKIGGHFVFDLSLALDVLVDLTNSRNINAEKVKLT